MFGAILPMGSLWWLFYFEQNLLGTHWTCVEWLWRCFGSLRFILITLLLEKKCPLNTVEMCKITWVVLWTKYSHGFILITILIEENWHRNSMEMCSIKLALLWTNFTHRFTLITLLLWTNVIETHWRCVESLWWFFGPILPMGLF